MSKVEAPRVVLKERIAGLSRGELKAFVPSRLKGTGPQWHGPAFGGEPVPKTFAEAVLAFLRRPALAGQIPGLASLTLADLATECRDGGAANGKASVWAGGWHKIEAYLRTVTDVHDDCFVTDEAGAREVARRFMYHLPEHHSLGEDARTPQARYGFSEWVMKIDLAGFQDWCVMAHRFFPPSVMWAVYSRRRRAPLRVAGSVVVGLTDGAYDRVVNGRTEIVRLRREDLKRPSNKIVVIGAKEWNEGGLTSTWDYTQFRTIMYQIAACCPDVKNFENRPHLAAYEGTERTGDRLKRLQFAPTGFRAPDSGLRIWSLTPRGSPMHALFNFLIEKRQDWLRPGHRPD
jgi:hypothetical protein